MTRQITYLHEDAGYLQDPDDSQHKPFGLEPTIEDISFERALSELGLPSDPETVRTVAQQFEGAVSLSFVPAGEPWYHNHHMGTQPTADGESSAPYSYTWTPTLTTSMPSARLYAWADYPGGRLEREIQGAAFDGLTVDISRGEDVRISLTGFYGDEVPNSSATNTAGPVPDGDPLVVDAAELSIPDTNTLVEMDSATLEINSGARARRGFGQHPVGAATGRFETSLDITKALTSSTQLELAYGGSDGVSARVDGANQGVLSFSTPGATSLEYQLGTVTPGSYSWEDFDDLDSDLAESLSYTINNVTVVAETDSDTAK